MCLKLNLLEWGRRLQNFESRVGIRELFKECQWRKRLSRPFTDAEGRKRRDQTGLGTPVVYAVKYEC